MPQDLPALRVRMAACLPALAALSLAGLALSGCETIRETQPPQTATQQLLLSHAAEIAAQGLAAAMPTPGEVFVDATHFKGDGSDYALSAIRSALLQRGLTLIDDKTKAQTILEVRMGALSIDQTDTVFGLPAGFIPIPGTLSAFPVPELSLYSHASRAGKAEFSAFAYDAKTGRPIAFLGPAGGTRDLTQTSILTLFTFGSRTEKAGPPPPPKQ